MKQGDITGQKFGQLTAIEIHHSEAKSPRGTVVYWRFRCDCGMETIVPRGAVTHGNTKSCGCLKRQKANNRTHGKSKTKVYQLWSAMLQRARGHRAASYLVRGIGVCERWNSFENFLADMGEPPGVGYSLERTDNDRDYQPGNCEWLPMDQQYRNRTNTEIFYWQGEKLTIGELARRVGVGVATLHYRMRIKGLSLEQAVQRENLRHPSFMKLLSGCNARSKPST